MRKSSSLENFDKAKEYIKSKKIVSLSSFAEYMGLDIGYINQYFNLVCCRYGIKKRPLGVKNHDKKGSYEVNF